MTPSYAALATRSARLLETTFYNGQGLWRMCDPAICNTKNRDWGADSLTNLLYFRWDRAADLANPRRHGAHLVARRAGQQRQRDVGRGRRRPHVPGNGQHDRAREGRGGAAMAWHRPWSGRRRLPEHRLPVAVRPPGQPEDHRDGFQLHQGSAPAVQDHQNSRLPVQRRITVRPGSAVLPRAFRALHRLHVRQRIRLHAAAGSLLRLGERQHDLGRPGAGRSHRRAPVPQPGRGHSQGRAGAPERRHRDLRRPPGGQRHRRTAHRGDVLPRHHRPPGVRRPLAAG